MREVNISAKITICPYSQLSNDDIFLIERAKNASKGAYAPYSNFFVGAAVALSDGEIVIGNNQENEAYPSGMCAERIALYSAMAQYPEQQIRSLAIAAYNGTEDRVASAFPCGACRQVLIEYEKRQKRDIRILVAAQNEVYIIESAESLLPLTFNM